MKEQVIALMAQRGITIEEITALVMELQEGYFVNLEEADCRYAVGRVIDKREVQYAILTGLAIDEMGERGLLPEPLQGIITSDEPLYGIDEVLGMAIANIYGTIGVTSFGYLDKVKPGIVGRLDTSATQVNTFADDLVAAIAAAAAAKVAHSYKDMKLEFKRDGQ